MIITFNHRALSQSFAGFSPRGLIYPPSSWGKISFTRRIAERAPPTSPYKSFFNQRPLRLGADTRGSNTVTPQLLPMCISAVLGVFILFCFHLGFVCICISHQETKRDDPPCTLQHPPLLEGERCQAQDYWFQTVRGYTLSGLASKVGNCSRTSALLGLWKLHLSKLLMLWFPKLEMGKYSLIKADSWQLWSVFSLSPIFRRSTKYVI